ncbi:MAG TPA: acyl carrier protein [Candidatus Evtepia faecigallinarum]|nr:acyl carrier protein [Candidatus Evtepia faecigallinarum]
MEQLLEILREIQPNVDYDHCDTLIDGHFLDSLDILALVAEVEEVFDIIIPTVEIVPENFNSAARLWDLIQRLREDG